IPPRTLSSAWAACAMCLPPGLAPATAAPAVHEADHVRVGADDPRVGGVRDVDSTPAHAGEPQAAYLRPSHYSGCSWKDAARSSRGWRCEAGGAKQDAHEESRRRSAHRRIVNPAAAWKKMGTAPARRGLSPRDHGTSSRPRSYRGAEIRTRDLT